MAAKKRSPMGRSPAHAKTERDELGRLVTILDEALFDKLCTTHKDGDFRNVTAVRCQVHPKMLSRWLAQGAASETGCLYSRLFVEFGKIEGEIRAEVIRESRNTQASFEETTYEDGKPSSKTVVSRRTNGIQWYAERRFRQFRSDWVPRDDESEVVDLLQPKQGALTLEQATAIATQLAENMPPALQVIFASKGWHRLETSHGT